jgi:hypothetical protein
VIWKKMKDKYESIDFAAELAANAVVKPVQEQSAPDTQTTQQSHNSDEYVSFDELMGNKVQQKEEQLLDTQWGKLTPQQVLERLQDTENKRAGLQSEAAVYKAQLGIQGSNKPKQNIPVTAALPKPPVAKDFTKDVNPDDINAMMEAQAAYFAKLGEYNLEVTKITMRKEFEENKEREKIQTQANQLAAQDPRFRNPDGSANIDEVYNYLSGATSNWTQLRQNEIDAAKYRELVESQAAELLAQRNGGSYQPAQQTQRMTIPKTIAATNVSGNSVGTNNGGGAKNIPWITDIMKGYGDKFTLPPGAKLKR